MRAENKKKVFDSYHNILEREALEQAKNKRYVNWDQNVNVMKWKSMAQIRRTLREKSETQTKVLDILNRANLLDSVLETQALAKPARIVDEPIIDKFISFLNSQTVSLPNN